jgi:hypothetical protein
LTDGKTPFDVRPPWPGAKQTGRRLAFARWLVRPDHPLTPRVAVNRIWKHHFGTGIVRSLANFGKAGMPPTHPELLDWLARQFVAQGWSIKGLHRAIMTSATYRQSSAVAPDRVAIDPDNSLYSRMPLVRLDAEALYDTLLRVAGRLDETPFGPSDAVETHPDGLVTSVGTPRGWRRLVYVRQARKQILTHAENFDYPPMNPNCVERRDSIVVLQALQMMNAGLVQDLAGQFAARARRASERGLPHRARADADRGRAATWNRNACTAGRAVGQTAGQRSSSQRAGDLLPCDHEFGRVPVRGLTPPDRAMRSRPIFGFVVTRAQAGRL